MGDQIAGAELPPPPSRPRLAPLPRDEWDDFLARLIEATGGPEHALNVFTTLGRHPELFRRWVTFGGTLLAGKLPPRTRELAILRTAVHCRADYEWDHHVDAARAAGVSEQELGALRAPLEAGPWDTDTRTVLAAVDEMHATLTLGDDSWAELHGLLGDACAIELVMLVGQYHLVALALRTLGVQPEAGA
jgi:AhpD family alkylhydroperoxidase